jgi:hypothetical protein
MYYIRSITIHRLKGFHRSVKIDDNYISMFYPDYNEIVAVITSLAEGDYNGGAQGFGH